MPLGCLVKVMGMVGTCCIPGKFLDPRAVELDWDPTYEDSDRFTGFR